MTAIFWYGKAIKRINVTSHPSVINFIGYIICSICSTKVSKMKNSFPNFAFLGNISGGKFSQPAKVVPLIKILTIVLLYLLFILVQQLPKFVSINKI